MRYVFVFCCRVRYLEYLLLHRAQTCIIYQPNGDVVGMPLLIIEIIYCYFIFFWLNPIFGVPSRAPTSPQATRENAWDWDGTGDSDPSSPPRIKGDDEPKIVSWRVLEGVSECSILFLNLITLCTKEKR